MRNSLSNLALANMPVSWPRWKHIPEVGTIAHILMLGHLSRLNEDEFSLIPGGFFAEVVRISDHKTRGEVRIITTPTSIQAHHRYAGWAWDDTFPVDLRAGAHGDGARLEIVPDDVQDAVRAFAMLNDWSVDRDCQPIVVEDGWLC